MATTRARTIALAAITAGGMLCEGLVCQPAQAGTNVLAFEGTLSASDEFYATLELFNAAGEAIFLSCGSTNCLTTNGAQGSIIDLDPAVPPLLGGAAGGTTSYTAGVYNGNSLADYFLFNLTGVTTQTVTSAELIIYSGTITSNLTLNLLGVSESTITALQNQGPDNPNTALYADLMSGASYGAFPLSETSGNPGTLLTFTITNEAALAAINAAISDGTFGFAGNVTGFVIPEPSTWVMILAGFAGLGLVARRRAARRRAAAAAG